jgi:hypothetical protein
MISPLSLSVRKVQRAREGEQLALGQVEVDRVFLAVVADRPLVEAVRRDLTFRPDGLRPGNA